MITVYAVVVLCLHMHIFLIVLLCLPASGHSALRYFSPSARTDPRTKGGELYAGGDLTVSVYLCISLSVG